MLNTEKGFKKQAMNVEIERKFLVHIDKWKQLTKPDAVLVRQGYLLAAPDKTIRVRVSGQKGFLTIKGISVGAKRDEYEYEIPLEDAEKLLDNLCLSIVSKLRHKILYHNKLWEVDLFLDNNEGLIVAEIELESEAEAFDIPDWVKEEVTSDKRYYNSSLSLNPYKKW